MKSCYTGKPHQERITRLVNLLERASILDVYQHLLTPCKTSKAPTEEIQKLSPFWEDPEWNWGADRQECVEEGKAGDKPVKRRLSRCAAEGLGEA